MEMFVNQNLFLAAKQKPITVVLLKCVLDFEKINFRQKKIL
jgi:hypothetical protein